MKIRQECEKDFDAVYNLVKTAFEGAEHTDGNEQNLVCALRKSEAFIPELSLVATLEGEIAGHIMLTKAKVGGKTVLALAPLAVLPKFQKQGIGGALINEAHKIAAKMGFEYVLVLGSENYYPKSGYLPAKELGVEVPEGIASENFMAIKLKTCAEPLCGAVEYAREFGV